MINPYEIPEEIEQGRKMKKPEIRRATKVISCNLMTRNKPVIFKIDPCLPQHNGYTIDSYRHNGYLFNLKSKKRYMIIASTATVEASYEPCKFMIRTIGPNLSLTHLVYKFVSVYK